VIGHDARQGRLADSGRPVQDQIADAIGGDGPAQQSTVRQDSALPLEFLKGARSHPIGQGRQPPTLLITVKGEEVLAQWARTSGDNLAAIPKNRAVVGIFRIIRPDKDSQCALRSDWFCH
jgi:hypothetical protein